MKIQKVKKHVANLHDKSQFVIRIKNLKHSLHHGLVSNKFHRVIKFNQNPWLKPCTVMNTDLRKKAKNNFEKNFFKLMSNAVFGKTMENVEDIKLAVVETRRTYFASEPNYHTITFFTENL